MHTRGVRGLSGRRAAFVFSTQPERNRQNEKTAHDDRRGGDCRHSASTIWISRADVVNAKDYCGKVLHEANAKKFA